MTRFGLFTLIAVLAMAPMAKADPTSFAINSFTSESDGGVVEDFTMASYAWESTDWIDSSPDNHVQGLFNIEVNSGPSMRPDFDYEITFDYSGYDIGFFLDGSGPGIHRLTLDSIKQPGTPDLPISAVFAKGLDGQSIGSINTDGFSIFFDSTAQEILDRGDFVTIQFSQVPEPGSLCLLAAGAVTLLRRRSR